MDLRNGISFLQNSVPSTSSSSCIYYNRWYDTKQMAGVAIFVRKSKLHLDDLKESRRGVATVSL